MSTITLPRRHVTDTLSGLRDVALTVLKADFEFRKFLMNQTHERFMAVAPRYPSTKRSNCLSCDTADL